MDRSENFCWCVAVTLGQDASGGLLTMHAHNLARRHLWPMANEGTLVRTHPENPTHPEQAYRARTVTRRMKALRSRALWIGVSLLGCRRELWFDGLTKENELSFFVLEFKPYRKWAGTNAQDP